MKFVPHASPWATYSLPTGHCTFFLSFSPERVHRTYYALDQDVISVTLKTES
jgi:hypothetical protein